MIIKLKKIIKLNLFFIISVFCLNTAFWSSWIINNWKSIKQLNTEVQQLKIEKTKIDKKILELQTILKNSWFLKENLSDISKIYIRRIIEQYDLERKQYESSLFKKSLSLESTTNTRIKLINLKKDLYMKLVPYINQKKLKDYLNFVKKDLYTLKEEKEIKDNSIKKNVILKEKVNKIKEKIIKHKEETQKILKQLIIKKIDDKINQFKNNIKFINLNKNKKAILLSYIIKKIDDKINQKENIANRTEILWIQIEIYKYLKNQFIKLKEDVEL